MNISIVEKWNTIDRGLWLFCCAWRWNIFHCET